jgi:hypothetical protein
VRVERRRAVGHSRESAKLLESWNAWWRKSDFNLIASRSDQIFLEHGELKELDE